MAHTAEQSMTQPVVTVGPRTSIDAVIGTMQQHHIQHAPVVDDDEVCVGIVTHSDIVRFYRKRRYLDDSIQCALASIFAAMTQYARNEANSISTNFELTRSSSNVITTSLTGNDCPGGSRIDAELGAGGSAG